METGVADRPMLGGCCVCLDEHGWADNPLVYCDGESCSVAVHQACYGITSVPTGPWFCKLCEAGIKPSQARCALCPYQNSAFKPSDEGSWAHVVCALYIPEIEFGDVSTMEPIVLKKTPDDRFSKACYLCADLNRPQEVCTAGACMSCNKSGCKLNFHVTCAQLNGLLCEEAGSSNTTKYCGYCDNHIQKNKRKPVLPSLSDLYKLCPYEHSKDSNTSHSPKKDLDNSCLIKTDSKFKTESLKSSSEDHELSDNSNSFVPTDQQENSERSIFTEKELSATFDGIDALSALANAALKDAESSKKMSFTTSPSVDKSPTNKRKSSKKDSKSNKANSKQDKKKVNRKKAKFSNSKSGSTLKIESSNYHLSRSENGEGSIDDYAYAPKHNLVSLSKFGEKSLAPSAPLDLGAMDAYTPDSQNFETDLDGLSAIDNLFSQQKDDFSQFFYEFGCPRKVSSALKVLSNLREENRKMKEDVNKMTFQRDQLLAIKARLSVPLKIHQLPAGRGMPESKPFG